MNQGTRIPFGILIFSCITLALGVAIYAYKKARGPAEDSTPSFFPLTDDTSTFPSRSTTTDQNHASTASTATPVFFTKRSISNETLGRLEARWYENNHEEYVGTSTPYYVLEYSKVADFFGIYIFLEPAGKARNTAETELKQALGMSEQEICNLKVYVNRKAPWLDDGYERVGLSFCPGSMPL